MPVTLARLLVLVFAFSYGCGLLRGLISRRRHGGPKPFTPMGRCDSAVAADESERLAAMVRPEAR
jgi:hypothetical protein